MFIFIIIREYTISILLIICNYKYNNVFTGYFHCEECILYKKIYDKHI